MGDNKTQRSQLNTTITSEVLTQFKIKCKADGIPLNTCLEAFMKAYIRGEYEIGLSKRPRV